MPFGQSSAAAAVTGTPALKTVADLAAAIARLEEDRVSAGRQAPLEVCFGLHHRSALRRPDASAAEMDDELAAEAEAGATWVTIQSGAATPDDLRAELDRLAPALARHRAALGS
jgi:hypothetical protein